MYEKYFHDQYCPIRAGNIDGSTEVIHDAAVIRALNSNYKPIKWSSSVPKYTIFVGNLSQKTDEESLRKYFSREVNIKSCHVVRDMVTGMSKRYAFIEVEDKHAVKTATKLNQTYIDQYKVIVQSECGRNLKGWKPRRLGGGLGGNRNSGQLRFGGIVRPFESPRNAFKRRRDDFHVKSDKIKSRN